jgi:hypothetical protein
MGSANVATPIMIAIAVRMKGFLLDGNVAGKCGRIRVQARRTMDVVACAAV